MNIQYRTYKESDLKELQELMLELGYAIHLDELNYNIKAISQQGGDILIAEKNGKIVGSVSVQIDARLAEGVYAEIVTLVVSEKLRGNGIGKALVQEAENWASKKVKKIRVRANSTRTKAHIFYERLGYNNIKTQKIFIKKV